MTFTRANMVITVVLAVVLSSCTSPGNQKVPMKNTITQQQANQRAEQYIRDAVSAVFPDAQLEILSAFEDSPCDDPTDNGPRGRIIASRNYWLNAIPADKHADYVNTLVQWWTQHDFTILTDDRPHYVWVENRVDGFRMAVQQTVTGPVRLSLGATSPCVWPNGTPAPQAP
jgi:type II secretory pathway pseudopilin PulG